MDINLKIAQPFISIMGICCISVSCIKRLDCSKTIYSFEIGIKTIAAKDSVLINDTIWLKIEEPTTLKDLRSSQLINYSEAENLGSAIAFQEIVGTMPDIVSAANDFNFYVKKGRLITSIDELLFREFLFSESSGRYFFELGVIPKRKGIFRLGFGNAQNVYTKSDKCTKAFFTINFKDTDQHPYFFPGGAGTPPGGGTYYFKVI